MAKFYSAAIVIFGLFIISISVLHLFVSNDPAVTTDNLRIGLNSQPVSKQTLASLSATLTTTGDAMINSNAPSSNYGNNSHLDIARTYEAPILKERSLIQFNLSEIPSNASVDSATLSVYLEGCGIGSRDVDILNIGRNKDAWQESEVTWSNKPSFDIGSVINSTAPCSSSGQYLNYDLKSFVTGWLAGTYENYGIVLYGNEGAGETWFKFFAGKEDAENPPAKLVIAYSVPGQSTISTGNDTETGTSPDTNSESDEVKIQPTNESATGSATVSAKKATTPSTTTRDKEGISGWRLFIFIVLVLFFTGIVAVYFFKIRPTLKSSAKREGKSAKETQNTDSNNQSGK